MIPLVIIMIFCEAFLSGCTVAVLGAVAIGEARRENSPEVRAQRKREAERKAAEITALKQAGDGGDAYAIIEQARLCFSAGYECGLKQPTEVFEQYSDQGYDIATYYYALYRLCLNPWGNRLASCREGYTCPCNDRKLAIELLNRLTPKGCDYNAPAYKRSERLNPCAKLRQIE